MPVRGLPIIAGVLLTAAAAWPGLATAGEIGPQAALPAQSPIVSPADLPAISSNGIHAPPIRPGQAAGAPSAEASGARQADAGGVHTGRHSSGHSARGGVGSQAGSTTAGQRSLASEPTTACIDHAAKVEAVPVVVIRTIMRTEGGHMGSKVGNTNGSHDLGWMQINDATWLDTLAKAEFHGNRRLAEYLLRYNGCYNVATGAWILRQYYDEAVDEMGTPHSVTGRAQRWARAIGYYNSHDKLLMHHYRMRAGRKLRQIIAMTKPAGDS